MTPGSLTSQLLRVGPHGDAHWVALRACLSVAVPLTLLVFTDNISWVLYASFGAFASLYGRTHGFSMRWRMQASVGLLLVVSVVLGTAVGISDQRSWVVVPVAALVAVVGTAVSERQQWHPGGALFLIFGLCACASVPSRPGDLPIALAVSAASAAFSVLVGAAGHLVRRVLAGAPTAASERLPKAAVDSRHVLLAGVGVAVAGLIATSAGIGHPYWAMVSAVVPLAARSWHDQVTRGIHRVVGTGVGLAVAAVLLEWHLSTVATVVVVVLLQGLAELLIGRNYAVALVAVTPLALLMVSLAHPMPTATLIGDRGIETVIGVLVGVVLGWVTRRRS